jgi:hypothetical protein
MRRDQRLEFPDQLGVAAERQLRLDQLFKRRDAHLLEASGWLLGKGLIGDVRQGWATPQRQRLVERRGCPPGAARGQLAASLCRQQLEAVSVEPLGIEPQLVPVVAGHDNPVRTVARPVGERPAQARDVDLHVLRGDARRTLAPQLVDQPIGGERLVGVQQQHRQQGTLLAATNRHDAPLVEGLNWAKYAEFHASRRSG